MSRILSVTLLLCSLGLMACGESDPTCSVTDNRDGTVTIRCPGSPPIVAISDDRTRVTCSIGMGETPGQKIIHCSDGTTVIIDDGHAVFPGSGSLAGYAERFGVDDHSGIVVRLAGTDHVTTTAADGSFRLNQVRAGTYSVIYEAEGRMPQQIQNVQVIDGVFHLETVELRGGRLLEGKENAVLSPDGDSALGVQAVDGAVWVDLWKVGELAPIPLGHSIKHYGYNHDGTAVFTLDLETFNGSLRHWTVEDGRAELVATHVREARFAGGSLVFQLALPGEKCRLHVWAPGDAAPRELGHCVFNDSWSTSPDHGAIVYFDPDGNRIFQELSDGWFLDLGPNVFTNDQWAFSPSGRHLTFFSQSLVLQALDRQTKTVRTLGSDVHTLRFSPRGEAVLFLSHIESGTALWIHDFDADTLSLLATGRSFRNFLFSPDGRKLGGYLLSEGGGEEQLIVLDRGKPEQLRTYPYPAPARFTWAPDGSEMLVEESSTGFRLWEVDSDEEPIWLEGYRHSWSPDRELLAFAGPDKVEIFDRRLRTLTELPVVGGEIVNLVWTPGSHVLLIERQSSYGSDLRAWRLGSTKPPEILLNLTFWDIVPDLDGEGFTYIQCEAVSCAETVLGHFDLEKKVATPLDGQVLILNPGRVGMLYQVQHSARAGWYLAPRP